MSSTRRRDYGNVSVASSAGSLMAPTIESNVGIDEQRIGTKNDWEHIVKGSMHPSLPWVAQPRYKKQRNVLIQRALA